MVRQSVPYEKTIANGIVAGIPVGIVWMFATFLLDVTEMVVDDVIFQEKFMGFNIALVIVLLLGVEAQLRGTRNITFIRARGRAFFGSIAGVLIGSIATLLVVVVFSLAQSSFARYESVVAIDRLTIATILLGVYFLLLRLFQKRP